jgi:hypothetical protein
MDVFERLLGISPDGGNGFLETAYFALSVSFAVLAASTRLITRRKVSKGRRR